VQRKAPARPDAGKAQKTLLPGTPVGRKVEPTHLLPSYRPTPPVAAHVGPGGLPSLPPPPMIEDSHVSTVAKAPQPGEEAAYEAYDQGKYLTALDLAVKAAQQGDPQAHTLVGRIFAEGAGTARDVALAGKWYARGAELGDAQAMFAYGLLLAEGQGVAKDRGAAAQMFEAAAVRRHPLANYNLALLFLAGDGKPENPYRGFMHMRFAAESGVVEAQYDLATLYSTGTGVDPNAFEAAKWYGKAAAAGYGEAQLDFGVMLFQGRGVPPDPARGAALFRSAAGKGLAVAQNRLARCYAHGAGVELNLVEAAKWHLIAKAGGIDDGNLDQLVARLSKADRGKAQKAADAWREQWQIQLE
jgi:TPR repeat protein